MSDIEVRLLGLVLESEVAGELAAALVAGEHFAELRLGALLDRIVAARQRGTVVDVDLLPQRVGEWHLEMPEDVPDPAFWSRHDQPATAVDLARQIRNDYLRRTSTRILHEGLAAVGDRAGDVITAMNTTRTALDRAIDIDLDNDGDQFRDLQDILDADMPYDWLVPGLLERQDRLVLTGTEGGGKSYFLRQLIICAAAGLHPFTRVQHDPVKVMVIDVENTERAWQRAAGPTAAYAAQAGRRDPRRHVKILCRGRLDLTNPSHEALVHRWVDQHKPDLLMIGPLYKMVPRAITNDDDAAPLITALDGLRDRGLTLLMEAHAGHATGPGGARDMRPRGSAALLGWPEFGLGIRSTASDPDLYDVVPWRGHRDARAWPTRLIHGQTLPWEAVDVKDRPW